jgi:hypothetical protein
MYLNNMTHLIARKVFEALTAIGHTGQIVRTGHFSSSVMLDAPWVREGYTTRLDDARHLHGYDVPKATIEQLIAAEAGL